MLPNLLLAAKRSYKLDAGLFYGGSRASNTVQRTLPSTNIALHVGGVDDSMLCFRLSISRVLVDPERS